VKLKTHRKGGVPVDSIPASLRVILESFSACFTQPSFGSFVALTLGWILCRQRRWITRVMGASGWLGVKHFSSFYRFFTHARWDPDTVARCLWQLLLHRLPEVIEVMVDDTLCHRAGPRIFGISMHHDGVASNNGGSEGAHRAFACGHSWVILSVRLPVPWSSRGCAVPLLMRLYRSPKRCPKALYQKRTQLAREMVEVLASWLPDGRRLHLTGDREYACRTVVRGLEARIDFTGPMPMDALLYGLTPKYSGRGRPRLKGARLPNPSQRAAHRDAQWKRVRVELYGQRPTELLLLSWICLWYTAAGTRPVRIVVTRDPKGVCEDRAYFSTETSATPEEILQRYAGRWLIEVAFRNAKQLLGLADPQNGFSRGKRTRSKQQGPQPRGDRGRRAVERTVPFVWTVYGVIVVWYLRSNRWQSDVEAHRKRARWYRSKKTPSYQDMLEALRTECLVHRLMRHPPQNHTRRETRRFLRTLGMAG